MGFFSDLVGGITGSTAAKAAKKAGKVQDEAAQAAAAGIQTAGTQASQLLQPFADVGSLGLSQAGFLTNPQAQFDFLQQNPLFQMSLDRLDEDLFRGAAARGRLTAGDTLEQLSQNTLLAASPLIGQQQQNISNLLNLGLGVAGQQGQLGLSSEQLAQDFLTGGAAAKAAGTVGAANARGGLLGNVLNLGSTPLSSFAPAGSLFGGIGGLFGGGASTTPVAPVISGFGSGLNFSQTPLGINTSAGSFGG